MGKVQYVYIKRTQSETGQTGTVTYDLPERGFLPELVVTAYYTPTASTDPAQQISDFLTKIEIMDGATVLKSISGKQAKALDMIHGNKTQILTDHADNAVASREAFKIHLGGRFNGVDYAPDLSRFSNLQIKLSWDASLTVSQSGVPSDADAAPATQFTVMCKVVREGSRYTHGYVRSNVIRTFTSATSTTTQTEIPRNEPLVGLGIEAGYNGFGFTDDINQIKLDFDNGAYIPLDLRADEVLDIQEEFFGEPFHLAFSKDVRDAKAVDTNMGFQKGIQITAGAGVEMFSYANLSGSLGVITLDVLNSTGVAYTTYHQANFDVKGYLPFHMWYCPMSKLNNGDGDTMDLSRFGRVVLETVSAAALSTASTPEVLTETLVTK